MAIIPFRASGKQRGQKDIPKEEQHRQRIIRVTDLPDALYEALKKNRIDPGEEVTLAIGQWWRSSASTVWGEPTTFLFVNLTTGETKKYEIEPYVEWESRMGQPGREEWDDPLYYPLPSDAAVVVASDSKRASSQMFRGKSWHVRVYVHPSNFRALLQEPKDPLSYREYNLLETVFKVRPEYMVDAMKYYRVFISEIESMARKGVIELPPNGMPKLTLEGKNITLAGSGYLWDYILGPFDADLCDEFKDQYPDACEMENGFIGPKYGTPLYEIRDQRINEMNEPKGKGAPAWKKYAKVNITHRKRY